MVARRDGVFVSLSLAPLSFPFSFSFPSTDGEDYVSHLGFFATPKNGEYLLLNDFFLRVSRCKRYSKKLQEV